MTSETGTIIVFAKPPVPGSVKTRLVPTLSPEDAARLHLAALSDTLVIASQASDRVELHLAGRPDDAIEMRRRFSGAEVCLQRGEDLGARLANAFDEAFARGVERVVIVGSDHPTLPPARLSEALESLGGADAVIGPTSDGGYYAVGLRRDCWPAARTLFRSVPWSTPHVFEETVRRARGSALAVTILDGWYDVDGPADLERLSRDARPGSACARFLEELGASPD